MEVAFVRRLDSLEISSLNQFSDGVPSNIIGRPFMVALSATVDEPNLVMFGILTHVGFPKSVRFWGDIDHFELNCCNLLFTAETNIRNAWTTSLNTYGPMTAVLSCLQTGVYYHLKWRQGLRKS